MSNIIDLNKCRVQRGLPEKYLPVSIEEQEMAIHYRTLRAIEMARPILAIYDHGKPILFPNWLLARLSA